MGSINSRWHLESSVDAVMVVVMNVMINRLDEFPNRYESVRIAKLVFETPIEGFSRFPNSSGHLSLSLEGRDHHGEISDQRERTQKEAQMLHP